MMKPTFTDFFLGSVLLVWIVAVSLGMYDRSYKIPGTVEMSMASVAGYLLGAKFLGGRKDKQ